MVMVSLDDMLFEFSSEVRLRILESLLKGTATVTEISRQLGVSMTEASRHFNRLSMVGMIKKNPERDYSITILGKTVLIQLGPLEFIAAHSDYFSSHDATRIPVKFLSRVNELANAVPTYTQRANIIRSVEKMKNISFDAKEYHYSILDNSSMELVLYGEPDNERTNFMKNRVENGIRFRALLPKGVEKEKIPQESLNVFIELHRSGNFDFRIIERTDLFLHMNEKEVSLLAFPDIYGKFDYLGFEATDDLTITWCNEVFNHYWNSSKSFF